MTKLLNSWVLSSAVQKLIRRSNIEGALECALLLEQINPGYMRRRLPVIAYEDIGAGNESYCLKVTQRASRAFDWEPPETAVAEAVAALAGSLKSRTCCDFACLLEFDPACRAFKATLQGRSEDDLLALALDKEASWLDRACALELLCMKRGRPNAQTLAALSKVSDAFQLSMEGCVLFVGHKSDDRLMPLTLPLAMEVSRVEPRQIVDSAGLPGSDVWVNGVPLCALDMHSSMGRKMLKVFCRSSSEIRRFARECRPEVDVASAVSLALFHLDSGRMKQQIVTSASEELRERYETMELARCGISAAQRIQLYAAITADADRLNEVRESMIWQEA